MFCMLGIGGLNVPNTGEGFQNDENRVWGRFQNDWKNIHPCIKVNEIWKRCISRGKCMLFSMGGISCGQAMKIYHIKIKTGF